MKSRKPIAEFLGDLPSAVSTQEIRVDPKRRIEELVATVARKPDVPAAVRDVPVRQVRVAERRLGPDRVGVLDEPRLELASQCAQVP